MNPTDNLIPRRVHVAPSDGQAFTLAPTARIAASEAAVPVAEQLAVLLRRGTGFALPIVEEASAGDIALEFVETLDGGPEAYQLTVPDAGTPLAATTPAGLFNAVQTLRQLFPPAIEYSLNGAD